MTTSIQDLVATKTRDEMLADEITTAQAEGLQTTTWYVGSVIRTLLVIVAQKLADLSLVIVEPIKGGFGDLLSTIGWARLWAKANYNIDAIVAQPATGTVDFTNSTAQLYIWPANEVIVAHSTTGKLYRNTGQVTISPSATTSNVPVAAIEVGTASNAATGYVTVLVGPSMNGVTVTNSAPILGSDDETVAQLVPRARASYAALSPLGPKDAYNYIAKTPAYAPTGSPITRASTFCDPTTGNVTVYCATATGSPVSQDIAIVQTALETWSEPWCTTSIATAVVEVNVPVSYTVWVKSGLTSTQIQTAIAGALADYFAALPIGGTVTPPATGTLYLDSLIVVISTATVSGTALGVVRADITAPTGDLALNNNQVAVLGTITPTVNFL